MNSIILENGVILEKWKILEHVPQSESLLLLDYLEAQLTIRPWLYNLKHCGSLLEHIFAVGKEKLNNYELTITK